jgi:hypothetical protein
MQESSQSLLQLVGAKGYKLNHIAGRGTMDSRPFQIFEGSNDILYIQISETLLKLMNNAKEANFLQFLKSFYLSARATDFLKNILDFKLEKNIPQRKLTELGQLISRIVTLNFVVGIGERGYRPDLINGAISMLIQEITALTSIYTYTQSTIVVEEYENRSFWLDFVKT